MSIENSKSKNDCFFKCKGNKYNLSVLDPAYQYQTQKIIQNSVRVPSSLYSMNLGALASYQRSELPIRANWNQMSDRAIPHFQTNSGGSQGSAYHGSSLKRTQTRERPGATTPGGYGVDIKHNSYNRYLNRLKGGKLLRRGPVPPTYGAPIPFNRAFPVYGGKTIKTSIVSNCTNCICPPDIDIGCSTTNEEEAIIYKMDAKINPSDGRIIYKVGDMVYAQKQPMSLFSTATIIADLGSDFYNVKFEHDNSIEHLSPLLNQIIPYFPCNCDLGVQPGQVGTSVSDKYLQLCNSVNALTGPDYLSIIEKYIPVINQFGFLPDYLDSYVENINN